MMDRDRFPVDPWRLVETSFVARRRRRHRDPLRRRQRLPGPARQPRRGAVRARARHVHERVPRDVPDPPCRAGVRLRRGRPDDHQRARCEGHARLRRRRAAVARRRRRARVRAHARHARRRAAPPHPLVHALGQGGARSRTTGWSRSKRSTSRSCGSRSRCSTPTPRSRSSCQLINRQDGEDVYGGTPDRAEEGRIRSPQGGAHPRARAAAAGVLAGRRALGALVSGDRVRHDASPSSPTTSSRPRTSTPRAG